MTIISVPGYVDSHPYVMLSFAGLKSCKMAAITHPKPQRKDVDCMFVICDGPDLLLPLRLTAKHFECTCPHEAQRVRKVQISNLQFNELVQPNLQ